MPLSWLQRFIRRVVKRFIYSQLYLRDAIFIILGRGRPLVRFTVEATPPSIYFNFALKPEQVERIEDDLGLPHPLAPIRCVAGEEPFHCLTLNVYRVSGLANGLRAEWSLYIREPSTGKPRYLVVEACADAGSMDPVAIISKKGEVSHARSEKGLATDVRSADGSRFRSLCPNPAAGEPVRAAPEWIEANDYIYWMNGICDRAFYDAGMANARTIGLDPSQVEIEDGTRWGRLAEPTPRNVVVFQDAIELVLSPWWNVDELGKDDAS
jgi:hypothetical protein